MTIHGRDIPGYVAVDEKNPSLQFVTLAQATSAR
jgi:hypothetical protein